MPVSDDDMIPGLLIGTPKTPEEILGGPSPLARRGAALTEPAHAVTAVPPLKSAAAVQSATLLPTTPDSAVVKRDLPKVLTVAEQLSVAGIITTESAKETVENQLRGILRRYGDAKAVLGEHELAEGILKAAGPAITDAVSALVALYVVEDQALSIQKTASNDVPKDLMAPKPLPAGVDPAFASSPAALAAIAAGVDLTKD